MLHSFFTLAFALGVICDLGQGQGHDLDDLHAPCFGCQSYARMHADDPNPNKIQSLCTFPCQCAQPPPQCPTGGPLVRDGCDCCMVCGSQVGESCDHKQPCAKKKGLRCEFAPRKSVGTCRAQTSEPCIVHGVRYEDGEQFKPDCGRLCTCQNGHYGCVSMCPQEDRIPSAHGCPSPRLVKIQGKCCKEWTCEPMLNDGFSPSATVKPTNKELIVSTEAPVKEVCKRQTSAWSACSKTCGMGLSIRVTNDNAACQTVQQARFCLVRPCQHPNWVDGKLKGKRCTRTMKVAKKNVRLKYKDCLSVRKFRPKYCSNCKKNKCCMPHITKTKTITFECRHGIRERHDFMWIKNCQCHKNCPYFSGEERLF